MLPLKDRFDAKHMPEPNSGCWLWLGVAVKNRRIRRGRFAIAGVDHIAARVAYELYVGPIPAGLFICHKCNNALCVNPDHLYAGTHADNMQDVVRSNRRGTGSRGAYHRGEDNPRARLTVEQVRAIRSSDMTTSAIARQIGISRHTIHEARIGRTWKCVA